MTSLHSVFVGEYGHPDDGFICPLRAYGRMLRRSQVYKRNEMVLECIALDVPKRSITASYVGSDTKTWKFPTTVNAGVHTKIISAFSSTDDHSISELSHFPSPADMTASNCPSIDIVLGDGLYAARTICAVAEKDDVTPYFLPKSNSSFRSHGVASWSHMTHALALDPQQWLSIYHMRSSVESLMSMLKSRLPTKISKMLPELKRTEAFLKAYVHNVRQCCYLTYPEHEMIKNIGS